MCYIYLLTPSLNPLCLQKKNEKHSARVYIIFSEKASEIKNSNDKFILFFSMIKMERKKNYFF
jgi:hypothetical protein